MASMYGNRRKVPAYMKRVGKSLGYAVGDVMSAYNPVISNISKTTKDTYREIQMSMKDMRNGSISQATKDFAKADQSAITNLIDDLKSGNWYNKDRQNNSIFDDFDDFDLDEDWGDGEESSAESAKSIIDQNEANSKKIINSVNQVGSSISKAYGYATAKNAEIISTTITQNTKAMYDMTTKGFNQVTTVLLNMNNTLDKMVAFTEPMAAHVQNSAIFFTKATQNLESIDKNLQILVDRTAYMDQGPGGKRYTNKKSSGRFTIGGFNAQLYSEMVKENIEVVKKEVETFLGTGKKIAGKNGKNLSPMQTILVSAVDAAMPKFFKESMMEMNKALSNAIISGMTKGSRSARNSSNPLINLLGSIFLPQDRFKNSPDTSNYNKGAVPFDGITRKSIVEVIPTYLAKIYAALGGEEKYYDYNLGRFVTLKDVEKKHEADIRNAAFQAGGDFRNDVMKRLGNNNTLKQEVDNFFVTAFMLGEDFESIEANMNNRSWLNKFGLSSEAARQIVKQVRAARQGHAKRNSYSNFQAAVYGGRRDFSKKMNEEEVSGISSQNYLNNGFYGQMDKHNKTQLDYIRSINSIVGNIYALMGGTNSSMGQFNVDNGNIHNFGNTMGERSNMDTNSMKRYRQDEMSEADLVKTYGMTNNEVDEFLSAKERKGHYKKIKQEVDKILETSTSNPKNKFLAKAKSIYEKPFEMMSHMIGVFTSGINDLFWGENGNGGIISRFTQKANTWFDSMKERLREKAKGAWDKTGIADATKAEWENIKRKFLFGSSYDSDEESGGASGIDKDKITQKAKATADKFNQNGAVGLVKDGAQLLSSGIIKFIKQSVIGNEEKDKKAVFDSLGSVMKEMNNAKGAMAIGGMAGAGVSLLTGAVVGPLAGAAIGAGVGFIAKSEKMQNLLFGEKKDGERQGGLISKEVQDKFKLSDDTKKKIKAAAPNLIAGGLGGLGFSALVGGPFGVAGNLIVGAGLGYLSTSDKFQDYLFGENGLANKLRDKIFTHIEDLFHNTANRLAGFMKKAGINILDKINSGIKGLMEGAANGSLKGPARLLGGALNLGNKAVNGAISAVGAPISLLSSHMMKKNLAGGYSVYGRKADGSKGTLTARERNNQRQQLGVFGNKYSDFDTALGNISNQQELEELMMELDNAYKGNANAEYFDKKGISIDKYSKGGIATLKDLAKSEGRNRNWEAAAQEKTERYHLDVLKYLRAIATGDKSELKDDNSGETTTTTQMDAFGNVHQYEVNAQGEMVESSNDSETKKSRQIMNKVTSGLMALPGVGTAIGGIKTLFGSLKDSLVGSEDGKKKGFLSGILEMLNGSGSGPLAWISKIFAGTTAGKVTASIMKNISLKGILTDIAAPALFGAAVLGKFDNIFQNIIDKIPIISGNDPDNSDNQSNGATTVKMEDGSTAQVQTDENGKPKKDKYGNYIGIDGSAIKAEDIKEFKEYGSNDRLSSRLKKNIVSKTLRGKGSTASLVLGKVGKGIKNFVNNVAGKEVIKGGVMKELVEKGAQSGLVNGIISTLAEFCQNKLPTVLEKIPFLKLSPEQISGFAEGLFVHLGGAVEKLGAGVAKVAGKVGKILPFINIAYIVGKGINAWGDAESILGITEKATTGQRIIATLIAVVNAAIPFIGDLIPDRTLVNIFMNLAPKLGIDVSGLEEQRDAASAEVEKYNEENGTNYTIQEYNEAVKGRGGIVTKAKNKIKSFVSTAKEKGLGNTIKNSAVGKGLSKAGKAVGAGVKKIGKGAMKLAKSADELTGFTTLLKLAKSGNFKDFWSYNGKDSGDDSDDDTGVKGIIRQVPIMMSKYSLMPLALGATVTKTVVNAVKGIVDKVKNTVTLMKRAEKEGEEAIMGKKSLGEFLTMKGYDDEQNPIGPIAKYMIFSSRLASVPIVMVRKIGHDIGEKVSNVINTVRSAATNSIEDSKNIFGYMKAGDLRGLWDPSADAANDSPDNPLNGLIKVNNFAGRLLLTVPTLLVAGGKNIKKSADFVAQKIVASASAIINQRDQLKQYSSNGDIAGLWSADTSDDDPDNPISGIMKGVGFIQKLDLTGSAIFHAVGKGISGTWEIATNSIKADQESLSSSLTSLKNAASSGNIDAVANTDFKPTDSNPLRGIFKGAFLLSRGFSLASALIHKIIEPVKETVGKAIDGLTQTYDKVKKFGVEKIGDAMDGVGKFFSGFFDKFTDWAAGDSGKGSGLPSGGSSGFVSQLDPRYANNKYAGSTFGEKGCGPAVAAMAANAMGKKLSINEAVNASRDYQNSSGTSMDYFSHVLGAKGIPTSIISGGSSNDIYNKIASGNKVILLGRDPSNTSKANSPFGPNNHYVLATGVDSNGNIRINDPELKGARSYSPDILKSATYGISGGGSSYDTNIAKKVWAFFKSKGFSPQAIAGIMGNLYQESGVDPTAIQGGGKGPAAGIAQWENYNTKSSRWKSLYDTAKKRGKDWKDLDTQLKFLYSELTGSDIQQRMEGKIAPGNLTKAGAKPMSFEKFKTTKDINQAMRLFEGAFERAGTPNFPRRLTAAKEYYKLYEGKDYTYDGADDSDTSSDSGTKFSSPLQAAANVSSIFSEAFGKLFGTSSSDSTNDSDENEDTSGNIGNAKGAAAAATAASNELGYKEGPGNRTKFGRWSGCDGQPWCAAFAAWAIAQAFDGKKSSAVKALYGCDNVNYTPTLTDTFKKNHAWHQTPEVGDEVMYGKPGPYHVGLVTSVDKKKKTFISVEGNSNDQVAKRKHNAYKDGNVIGFGRPDYSKANGNVTARKSNKKSITLNDDNYSATGSSIDALLSYSGAGSGLPIYGKRSGAGSNLETRKATTNMLNDLKTTVRNSGKNGSVSAELVNKLLEAIAGLLNTIADNTAPIDRIYTILSSYLSGGGSGNNGTKPITPQPKSNNKVPKPVDSNISALVGVLAELAKG